MVELSPIKYRVVFDGCGHDAVVSDEFIHSPIEQQLSAKSGIRENVYVCPGCAKGAPGFCHNTVLHKVAHAERLSVLDNRRLLL